jgi:hypothetical protein
MLLHLQIRTTAFVIAVACHSMRTDSYTVDIDDMCYITS